jgi:nitric oxide reductase NorE protein
METRESLEDEDGWGPLSGLPGNPMMWILILSEFAVFGAFFVGFAIAHAVSPATFDESQARLDRLLGGINTLVLVTSGWLAAVALRRKWAEKSPRAPLLGAMLLGTVFLAVKVTEYGQKFGAGISVETNTFWTLYFLMTGFHALHVVLGIVILGVICWHDSLDNVETGTAFWHMVDIIWVILYPLIYLLR